MDTNLVVQIHRLRHQATNYVTVQCICKNPAYTVNIAGHYPSLTTSDATCIVALLLVEYMRLLNNRRHNHKKQNFAHSLWEISLSFLIKRRFSSLFFRR